MASALDFSQADDNFGAALVAFRAVATAFLEGAPALRPASSASPALQSAFRAALLIAEDEETARRFFLERFMPRHLPSPGFLTGYYEPRVLGSLTRTERFRAPVLARPADLVTLMPGEAPAAFDPTLTAARRRADGGLEPYPERARVEDESRDPIVYLEDAVEVFLVQVQGSARVTLPDGREARLVYDGRNGRPYTSIGRKLIEAGEVAEAKMSLARLKAWLRTNGLEPGQRGRELMRSNASYIFFRLEDVGDPPQGPTGGAGLPLTPLRSLAVDRTLWSYGLPFWIEAELPWRGVATEPFRRLMIAHDTGSAIIGASRFDLYFGSGHEAGRLAGGIRHPCRALVLTPREAC